jgi:hypothetical protein
MNASIMDEKWMVDEIYGWRKVDSWWTKYECSWKKIVTFHMNVQEKIHE